MPDPLVALLLKSAEPMAAPSTAHLTLDTRRKLAANELSVHAYPNEYGGFVHVGEPLEMEPAEADLAKVFDIARRAGLVWLKFDGDACVVEGLPTYDEVEPTP